MPVLVNSQTGLAEDLPQQEADKALSLGSHQIPLNDPNGNPVVASLDQAQDLLGQGHKQPSPEQLQKLLDYTKYSSVPEQIKTGLEGAAEAATFGGSTAAEVATGLAKPEAIRARRETNPGVHGVGQVFGLAGSSLIPGVGAANVLARAGEGAAGALGLGALESGILSKVGSSAVKGAVETALMSGTDELSKLFSSDPNQTAESAIADIGLSGLMGAGVGGALGTISPLWKATSESKLGKVLGAIKDRANGDVANTLPTSIDQAVERSGISVAPEIKAALESDPHARQMFQSLQESTSLSGEKSQKALTTFNKQANESVLDSLGKTPEDVNSLANYSTHEAGSDIQKTLNGELKEQIDPISKQFEKYREEFKGAQIGETRLNKLSEDLSQLINTEKYNIFNKTPQAKLAFDFLESVPKLNSMEDLSKSMSLIGDATQNPEMWRVGKQLKNIFRSAEENMTTELLGEKAPGLIAEHQAARGAYRSAMDTIDELNDRLHVGRYSGPGSFQKKLSEMSPEDILRRLSPKNDAGLLNVLQEKFPGTANSIKEAYLNQALKIAGQKSVGEEAINIKTLFNQIDNWSPEIKKFVLPAESLSKISAIKELIESVPKSSELSKKLDSLWSKFPAGAISILSLLTGHNPATGFLLGHIGKLASREIPDAVKLATLKFLGNSQPINSAAFKSSIDLAAHMLSGESLVNKATKSIFKAGQDVLPQSLLPKEKTREKLKTKIEDLQTNNSPLLDVGGQSGYYMPEHATALAATSTRVTQYLAGLKPNTDKLGPLDPDRTPSKIEEQRYNRALDIAEQPLVTIKSLKEGTLTPQDVKDLNAMYPGLYQRLSQKIQTEMVDHVSDGKTIPYPTRLSLGLFVGKSLDSTMTPQAIMAAQPQQQQGPQGQPQPQLQRQSHGSMTALNKIGSMYQTPAQSREADKLSHG